MFFDSDTWQEILSSIKSHKLRTTLTAFGVFWGIFMLILLMGIGEGLETGVLNNFADQATNSIYVWSEKTSLPYKGLRPGRYIRLDNHDSQALRASFEQIQYLAPRMRLWGEFTVDRGNQGGAFQVFGDVPDFGKIQARKLSQGRFINQIDMEQRRKVAVIGPRVQEVLFDRQESPLGQYLRIKGVYFQVVGVFRVDSLGSGRNEAETIHIPLSTMQRAFNMGNRVGWYAIAIKDHYPIAEVEDRIKSFLAVRHKASPEDKQAIGSWNTAREYQQLQGLFRGIRSFFWIVGVGTLLAGIVGVSNIMLIIVKERTREIGIRKAVGATPWSIVSLILQESVIITGVSGYTGLVVGVGLIELIGRIMKALELESEYFTHPEVDFRIALAALVLLVLAGTLAGLFPALRAARIKPIEALRDE